MFLFWIFTHICIKGNKWTQLKKIKMRQVRINRNLQNELVIKKWEIIGGNCNGKRNQLFN